MWTINGINVRTQDLAQRYGNNYIEVSIRKEKPEVVLIDGFDRNIMWLNDGRNFEYKAVNLVRDFPSLGAVDYEGIVHYLKRSPGRQWTRGFNRDVLSDFCRVGSEKLFSYSLDLAKANAAFYPKFTPLEEGFPKIKKEEICSFAHNQKFWFSGNKRAIYLWYEEVPVGEVHGDVLFFNPQCKILKQEVIDEFKNDFKVI